MNDDGTGFTHAKSAVRALDVLELLSRRVLPQRTIAIARDCGIPKSSAHHLLNVMRSRGFVTYYEDDHAWGLGPKAVEVGCGYQRSETLQRLARPILARLAGQVPGTVHLAVLVGSDVLYLCKQRPPGVGPKLITDVGVRLPAHLTAVGLMMLAGLPDSQIRALYRDRPMEIRTGRGPATVRDLFRVIAEVRLHGMAYEQGMVTPDISCLAASVTAIDGLPAAAIGVSCASKNLTAGDVTSMGLIVQHAADRLTRMLNGGASSRPLRGALSVTA